MFEALTARVLGLAQSRTVRIIAAIAATPLPPGVTAEPADNGVRLSGHGLKRRIITDPSLRSFGR